jgi:hypothetical protein
MAQKLPTLIVTVSHKNNRLPIPYRKRKTVSCLSWARSTAALLPRQSSIEEVIAQQHHCSQGAQNCTKINICTTFHKVINLNADRMTETFN